MVTTTVTATAIAVISGYFIVQQRLNMTETLETRRVSMVRELVQKGQAITSTMAVASERALAFKDFLFLAQILRNTQQSDPQFVYAALVNNENVALIHTNAAHSGETVAPFLLDDAEQRSREVVLDGRKVLEVAAPLTLSKRPWGQVRLGLSFEAMNTALRAEETKIAKVTQEGITTTILFGAMLMALGFTMAAWAAGALTRPLLRLLEGVKSIQDGTFGASLKVGGGPEFENLALAFNDMSFAVRRRESALQDALRTADEANRLKSEFLANISHELRTPLNSIINVPNALVADFVAVEALSCSGCNAMFESEGGAAEALPPCPDCGGTLTATKSVVFIGSAEDHQRLNAQALAGGKHLLNIVNDLLDFAKLEAGRMELQLEAVAMPKLVENACNLVRNLADAKKQQLHYEVASAVPELTADPVKVSQVLINLLGNAVKFTPTEGTVNVMVDAMQETQEVHIRVKDTGIGIPTDKQQIIFEPFRQVDGSHTRSYGGTGLGLAICKQVVEMHKGKIWVESILGEGSTFHVTLPATSVKVSSGQASTGQFVLQGPQQRVLIVDDDVAYLNIATRVLHGMGMQVESLSDPQRVFSKAAEIQPDFVILDVMMPRVSGFELMQKLKGDEKTRNIPLLVSTAFHSNQDVALTLGGIVLPKPWTAGDLALCLVTHKIVAPEAFLEVKRDKHDAQTA